MTQTTPSSPDLIASLKALGDDSRLRVVHLLSKGSFNVQELTTALDLSQSTVSHHLKVLEQAGLVNVKREGTWKFYALRGRRFDEAPENNESLLGESFEEKLLHLTISAVTRTEKLSTELASDTKRMEQILNTRRDKAKAYFNTVAREWNTIRDEAQGKADYLPALKELIPTEATLLELGCGSGALLKELFPRRGETIGVDYSEPMIQEARDQLEQLSPAVDLRLGYLEHLPVGDESIDYALGCMVFHHLAEPREALQDIFRVLRCGGKLVVVDLTKHTNELMRDRFADLWLGFDPCDFANWIRECGFQNPQYTLLGEEEDVFLIEAVKKSF